MVGNEAHARKVVIETFSQVFAHPAHLSDQQFSMAVFSLARSLCRDARPDGRRNDGDLLGSEREVLSLLFDAQLSRGEVGMVTGLEDEEVRAEMVSGLRKLRGPNGGSIIPAFLRRR